MATSSLTLTAAYETEVNEKESAKVLSADAFANVICTKGRYIGGDRVKTLARKLACVSAVVRCYAAMGACVCEGRAVSASRKTDEPITDEDCEKEGPPLLFVGQ